MGQHEIARESGISKSHLTMIMSGQCKANAKLASKLSPLKAVN